MLALFGGIIVLLSFFSLSTEFTLGGLLWFIAGLLLLYVAERSNGSKRK
jgi:hypothetical protein